jgi:hypothetical protein
MGIFVSTEQAVGEDVSVLPLPVTIQLTWADKMFKAKLQTVAIIHTLDSQHCTRKRGVE